MKKPTSYLAIDMGAGSIRVVQGIFSDRLVINEIGRFDNTIETIDGHDRWNLQRITNGIKSLLVKAFRESKVPIVSIGTDSWGVDFVLLNTAGKPMENPVAYRDKRTSGMDEMWNSQVLDGYETFVKTGINYNIFNSLYQFLSIKNKPVLKACHSILFTADYINYYFSGKRANELTLSGTTQMLNVESRTWDTQITGYLGIENKLNGTPVMPGTNLGELQNCCAYSANVVTVAGHDTACAVAAIPYTDENFAFIATGTWCIAGMLSDKPLLSREAYDMGITNELAADGRFRPLKNIMGLWLIQQLRVAFGSIHSYSEIDEMAQQATPSKVLVNPDDPAFFNPKNMKEAFDAHLADKIESGLSSPAEYYRCAYESLATSFKKTLNDLETLRGQPFSTVHITGGGSKSAMLCALTANYTGKNVVAGPVEGAAIGNLMIQAVADGVVSSYDEARKMITRSFNVKEYHS
ncbi:MAG: FGGY-family carbohydrate kinase [Prolixibacteraceae bacterium]|jgi:rhamnulokinase|nr:FGGY-family carbohydrate kinase [Prolixibacteraceae bacterium]